MSEYTKKYYQCNKEKIKQRTANWIKNNKERFLNYQKIRQKYYRKTYPLKTLLANIKYRCNNPNDKKYKYYGGKGIKCLISLSDLQFLWDRDLAKKMVYPSIDRLDNSKDYSIDNCRFVEMAVNRINTDRNNRKKTKPYIIKIKKLPKITTAICLRITPELKVRSQKLSDKHISQTQQFEAGVEYCEKINKKEVKNSEGK